MFIYQSSAIVMVSLIAGLEYGRNGKWNGAKKK